MSFGNSQPDHNDDYFSSTRMSFGDHIEDLRFHLIRAIIGFFVAMIVSFPLAYYVMGFMTEPIKQKLDEFYKVRHKRKLKEIEANPEKFAEKYKELLKPRKETMYLEVNQLAKVMGIKPPEVKEPYLPITVEFRPKPEDLPRLLPPQSTVMQPGLVVLSIQETLMVWLQIAIVGGIVIGSPWIFIQIWAFIAAGLYPHEKRLVNVYLPFAIFLFIGGVIFCYFIVIPRAIDALLWFNHWLDFTPQIRLSEWMSFAIWVPVIFGVSFETPLIMVMMYVLGIGSVDMYRRVRKFALFGMAVAAGVLTPTADAITMLYLLIPMAALYEIGIWICVFMPRRSLLDTDVPDEEEMIEV